MFVPDSVPQKKKLVLFPESVPTPSWNPVTLLIQRTTYLFGLIQSIFLFWKTWHVTDEYLQWLDNYAWTECYALVDINKSRHIWGAVSVKIAFYPHLLLIQLYVTLDRDQSRREGICSRPNYLHHPDHTQVSRLNTSVLGHTHTNLYCVCNVVQPLGLCISIYIVGGVFTQSYHVLGCITHIQTCLIDTL
jgi:hypothetical protein